MRLGWDAALWEDGGVPEALDCRWGELSAEQQALAAALGYEQEAWDKEHVGHDQAVAAVRLGLGRTVVFYHRSSTSYQID